MWGGQDSLLLIQYFTQAHAELSKTSDVWNPAFLSNLTPCFNKRFQPTNTQQCLTQWFSLFPTPVTCILVPSLSKYRCFCSKSLGKSSYKLQPGSCHCVWTLTHYTRGRSSMVMRTSSCGWGTVFSSLALQLNALWQQQMQLQIWMPKVTPRKTQLIA